MIARLAACLLVAAAALAQTPPRDARALLVAAIADARAGRTQAAVRQFRAILRLAPPPEVAGQARLELVRIHQRRGDWWQAAEQLEALRQLSPGEAEYAYQLGLAYRNLSKASFEHLLAVAPGSARVAQMYGEQYSVGGETGKAVEAFRRAIAIDPKLAGSHLALAVIFLRQNRRDEALAEIDRELALSPESAAAKQVRQAIAGAAP